MTLPGGIILADSGNPPAPIRDGFTSHGPIDDPTGLLGDAGASLAGMAGVPAITAMEDALVGAPMLMFGDIFYNQIWVIPTSLQATNPRLNTPILFKIWNAFLFDNELLSIDASGDTTGLTLAIEPGDVIGALGIRTTSITIDDTAPLSIEADFVFHFELDDGDLHFTASRAFVISQIPETGIKETWTWATNTIVSDDGTEQRISLRRAPKRIVNETLVFTEAEDIRNHMNLMFGFFKSPIIAPFVQYGTRLKAKASQGDTALVFNSLRSDLRDFGLAYLYDNDGYQVIQLGVVSDGGANIAYPLERDFGTNATICPAFIVMPGLNSTITRRNPDNVGTVNLSLSETGFNLPFLRPSNGAVLTQFNGLPVLERNANGTDFDQSYDTGSELRDYGGVIEVRDPWKHTQIAASRNFICQRVLDPADWDYWRVFADYAKGSLNPFYLPTYREDFGMIEKAEPSSSDVTIKGSDYGLVYYDHEPFKQIAIISDAGIHYASVTAVEAIGGDNKLYFDPPLPDDPAWFDNQRVSLLMKVRISDDKIVCDHYNTYTQLAINLRTVDE